MADVLIVDDDRDISDMLSEVVATMGHTATAAFSLAEGLKAAAIKPFTVVLLDVCLPDGDGTEKLPTFRSMPSLPEVIIITGFGSREGAELALNSGAWDYISKTTSIAEIKLTLSRAIQYKEEQTKEISIPQDLKLEGLLWKSDRMAVCIYHLSHAVRTDASVLITGETGTGKELFARAIHNNSNRASRSFVTVDCAALPPTLAESLLFGHEKGAFTGADKTVEGMVKQADGGTLFLDEIGELPLGVQKSFLRVLQEQRFRPIGAKSEVTSNFRVVVATNRNLNEMVSSGKFRQDLLHRISSIVIVVPPLRRRNDDVTELILHYTKKLCQRYGMSPKSFSPEFLETMADYSWPGNVRELINSLEWSIAAAGQEITLYSKHLPTSLRLNAVYADSGKTTLPDSSSLPPLKNARESGIREIELLYLQKLMDIDKGDFKEACRISGVSRPQLYALMRKHHITK
jgi:two-component system NtrC family response regulator